VKPLKIAIVAGEPSGDILGAGLIQAIKRIHPTAEFTGIAGAKMLAAGCNSLFPIERLAVMGLVEVIGRLRELINIRRQLYQQFKQQQPDLFIGIDSPDFNIPLAEKLKRQGIPTVHYVSPSLWAWRPKRIKKIIRAVNLMLALFPFELPLYEKHKLPVVFVGHPLADAIADHIDTAPAREALGLAQDAEIIALMPGSRLSEIKQLGADFIRTALYCLEENPYLKFIAPMANAACHQEFTKLVKQIAPQMPITILNGQSQAAMAAANIILLASGTATLEAMLLKRPMVVAYRVAPLTYQIMRRLVTTKYIALPNILANRMLVPEFIQYAATPERLSGAVLSQLSDNGTIQATFNEFQKFHDVLRRNASQQAAKAALALVS
jgi:lipid-A-disaccharide synthase